jgi:hypothetical protein
VSPFRPFVLPQRRVCSRAALLTHHSQPTTQYLLSSAAVHESPSTSHKSRLFMDLQPLRRSQKSQLLWNQANPASFAKTPGVGVPRKNRAIESATYSLFFQDPVMTQLLSQSAERAPTQSGWQSEFLGHFFSPVVTRHSPLATFRPPGDSNMTESSHLPDNRLWGLREPLGSSCEVLSNALRLPGGTP